MRQRRREEFNCHRGTVNNSRGARSGQCRIQTTTVVCVYWLSTLPREHVAMSQSLLNVYDISGRNSRRRKSSIGRHSQKGNLAEVSNNRRISTSGDSISSRFHFFTVSLFVSASNACQYGYITETHQPPSSITLTLAIGRLTIRLLRTLIDMTYLNSPLETDTDFGSDKLKLGLAAVCVSCQSILQNIRSTCLLRE
jgi:hypothetical protein